MPNENTRKKKKDIWYSYINFFFYVQNTVIVFNSVDRGLSNTPTVGGGVKILIHNVCPGYNSKLSDGVAPILEFWKM